MKLPVATTALLTIGYLAAPALAAPQRVEPSSSTAQAQPTRAQVHQACTQNQAQTLPPFKDVPPGHWAFKPVMSMYYCGPGPLREAKPSPQSQQSLDENSTEQL
ncbi:MAG TPA: hypothetical protein V6D03_07535 [Candidatus Caenarcaniphilales bacterium]